MGLIYPPGGSRWVNEPARASEPLGVHGGTSLKVVFWNRLDYPTRPDHRKRTLWISMSTRGKSQLEPVWASRNHMNRIHSIESKTSNVYNKHTCSSSLIFCNYNIVLLFTRRTWLKVVLWKTPGYDATRPPKRYAFYRYEGEEEGKWGPSKWSEVVGIQANLNMVSTYLK